ncbi:MAG: transcriptional regulator [Blastocatellia bacterium]
MPITLKAFDTLSVLVRSSGHIVEKDHLMAQVWPDAFVEEANLTQYIYRLRKILGISPDGRPYIETVARRGYRFTATIREVKHEAGGLVIESHAAQTTIDHEAITHYETRTISVAFMNFVF